jgi:hypothetical protein
LMAEPLEDLYTLKQAAKKLAFPSADALRMYLSRRPGLVEDRYRRVGRSWERLLTESEIRKLYAMVVKS